MSIQTSKTTADNVPVWTMVTFKVGLNEKPCRFAVISTLAAIHSARKSTVRIPRRRALQPYATLEARLLRLRRSSISADSFHLQNVFTLIPAGATLIASPAQFRVRTNAQRGHELPSLEMAVCSRQFGHTESPRS